MTTETIILLAVLLIILFQTSYLLYKTNHQQARSKNTSVYVDTSVLIDGRILAIAETGFLTADLVIPRSVIGELQYLADGSDHEKRARARHGLDIAQKLRKCDSVTVTLLQDGSVAKEGVDERLLSLAKKRGGMICTIDYNLNKVAQVEGISVLNVNELAKKVRFVHLPGEVRKLELTQKGHDSHQAVGYIEDGTMVVVENASRYMGKTVEVEFVRAIQTDAGKMMFAKLHNAKSGQEAPAHPATKVKAAIKTRQHNKNVTKPSEPRQNKADRAASSGKNSKINHRQKPSRRPANSEDRLLDLVENQR